MHKFCYQCTGPGLSRKCVLRENPVFDPSALFIVIFPNSPQPLLFLLCRWEVWRKYEHFCRVYDTLCTKYANHKIARLPSLERIKKTWKNMSGSSAEPVSPTSAGASANSSSSSSREIGAAEEDSLTDDAIFLGHAFLQKLQVSFALIIVFACLCG